MEELIKMAAEAKERLHLIEVATKQSLQDLEYLMELFPNGFSMFNQVLSWHEFEPTTIFFTHKGDSIALTGFCNGAITGYNRDKSGFIIVEPNELPFEAVPDVLALLVERITPKKNENN